MSKSRITERRRGFIEAESYAALGVLWRGSTSVESLWEYVSKAYGVTVANLVWPDGNPYSIELVEESE